MKANEIKEGMLIIFTSKDYPEYNGEFTIHKVTDKRISWFVKPHKSSWGKNTMKVVWTSIDKFQKGLDDGTYKIKNSTN